MLKKVKDELYHLKQGLVRQVIVENLDWPGVEPGTFIILGMVHYHCATSP